MIWAAFLRVGTILSVGSAVLHLYDEHTRAINSSRIYRSSEAARFLGVSRKAVIRLIRENKISAKLVSGNYRILGQNLIEYLSK